MAVHSLTLREEMAGPSIVKGLAQFLAVRGTSTKNMEERMHRRFPKCLG
jgi:hypothetical protein